MATEQPTAGDGGASSADPIDRIEAYLAAQDGDTTGQDDDAGDGAVEPKNAAKPTDKPEDGEPGETQEPQFTTTHLAQFLGIDESMIDVDETGQPVFKTKIDGEERSAKFEDFLKDHQKQGAADKRMREAAAKEQAADRKLQEADQAIQGKLQEQQQSLQNLAQINAILQQELIGERQSVNWDELWAANAAQARAYERRFDERQGRINAVFQQIQARNAQAQQQAEAMRKGNAEKAQAAQRDRLLKLVPEWADEETYGKERREILAWVEKSGFEPEDLDLNKASQVAMLRRAWQHDTLQKSKPEIEHKLRTAPKLVKPGQAQSKSEQDSATLKSLKQNIRSASPKDSSKAFEQYLLATGQA